MSELSLAMDCKNSIAGYMLGGIKFVLLWSVHYRSIILFIMNREK